MAFSFVYISVRTFFEGVFQMKKWTSLFLIAVLAAVWLTAVPTVSAQTADAYDLLFEETMTVFLEDQGQDGAAYTSHKELLYDVSLEPLGAIYTYELAGECGYTVIINSNGGYEVTESFFGREDPYAGCTGLRIYVLSFVYWEYVDGHFIDLGTDEILTDERVDSFLNTTYRSNWAHIVTSETIDYAQRSITQNDINATYPCYYSNNDGLGDCVAVAGASVIGYFDRFYENLIPDFTPGYGQSGAYMYLDADQKVNVLIDDLLERMNDAGSITAAEFRSGMTSYINDQDYYVSFYSCMTGNSVDFSKIKSRINMGLPVVILTLNYLATEFYNVTEEKVNLTNYYCPSNHAMAGYGYQEITYTFSNGSKRTDQYIKVHVNNALTSAYLNIAQSDIRFLYAVDIYE